MDPLQATAQAAARSGLAHAPCLAMGSALVVDCKAPMCRCISPCEAEDEIPILTRAEEEVYWQLRYTERRGTRRIADGCKMPISVKETYRLLRRLQEYGLAKQIGCSLWVKIS